MWLECIGVDSEYCCKEVYRYRHNSYYFSLLHCISSCFMLFLCNIANVAQGTFEIVQKSRSREHGDIINYIDKNVRCLCARESRDFHVRGTA